MNAAPQTFARRRRQLADLLGPDAVAVIPGARAQRRNGDNAHPFRQDSDFLYLCGFDEPDATLVITSDGRSTLLCRDRDPRLEQWHGPIAGPQLAREQAAVDEAHSAEATTELMPPLLAQCRTIWMSGSAPAGREGFHGEVASWLQTISASAAPPSALEDLQPLVAEMRLVKEAQELEVMREAARISCHAHAAAMRRCAQLVYEGRELRAFHLEAEVLYECRRRGAQAQAYQSNVASGANACVLHHLADDQLIHDGELVLLDAGCELSGYASDVTRTFPANGRFSDAQRQVYDVVLASRNAAVQCIRPGRPFRDVHRAAVFALAAGMLDIGLISRGSFSNPDDVVSAGAYQRFFVHATSHWLGLDYHDAGPYVRQDASAASTSTVLRPGMVMTVEPGLYIRAAADVPARFHDIAVRIEDDVIVSLEGSEVISTGVPIDADEIERLMRVSTTRPNHG